MNAIKPATIDLFKFKTFVDEAFLVLVSWLWLTDAEKDLHSIAIELLWGTPSDIMTLRKTVKFFRRGLTPKQYAEWVFGKYMEQ